MTNNRLNNCTYCMAAHTAESRIQKVPAEVVRALREGTPIANFKLEALRLFSIKINQNRGFVDQTDLDAFLAAGYTKANILEVIVGTGLKVLSNYTNHIAETPVDKAFQADAWSESKSDAA